MDPKTAENINLTPQNKNYWKITTIIMGTLFLVVSTLLAMRIKNESPISSPLPTATPFKQIVQPTSAPAASSLSTTDPRLAAVEKALGCTSQANCQAFCSQAANKAKCDAVIKQVTGTTSTQNSPAAETVSGPLPIGYIGCSNSANSAIGYQATPGKKLMWPGYATGAGGITMWTDPKSNYWTRYDAEVVKFGQPSKVWVQLCEPYQGVGITDYAHVKMMLANLKSRSPNAVAYISAINVYDPRAGMCALMGPNGQGEDDTEAWRNQAVKDGLAKRGPDMGVLTISNTVSDHCHPTPYSQLGANSGEALLGTELHNFFDNL